MWPDVKNLQRKEAEADRADNTYVSLVWKLVEFLTHVMQQTWTLTMQGHATGQAQSSGHATKQAQSQADNTIEEECEEIVYEIVITWFNTPSKQKYYTEPALLLNKKLWDIMVRNKEGLAKENMFKEWCRRVYMHAEARGGDEDDCYKSLALDLLSNDLTPEQRLDPKYKIRRDRVSAEEKITDKQRSWINHMLRKNLGDYRVAYFIFNNGLPEILDLDLGRSTRQSNVTEHA